LNSDWLGIEQEDMISPHTGVGCEAGLQCSLHHLRGAVAKPRVRLHRSVEPAGPYTLPSCTPRSGLNKGLERRAGAGRASSPQRYTHAHYGCCTVAAQRPTHQQSCGPATLPAPTEEGCGAGGGPRHAAAVQVRFCRYRYPPTGLKYRGQGRGGSGYRFTVHAYPCVSRFYC
jgi:hypothetical protein